VIVPSIFSNLFIIVIISFDFKNENILNKGWRIPKGQSQCTIQRLENIEGAITMYNPEVGEYRRGNHNVQPRGWRIPKGQSKCTISEVGEYRYSPTSEIVHFDCPFGILQPLDCTL
jgi:hypothetical protein